MTKKTDFIDADMMLKRDAARGGDSYRLSASGIPDDGDVPAKSISELSLGRLAKHKEEIKTGMASAMSELETLRRRQRELEQEKREFEELDQKREEYETGKREVLEHLNQAIIALEKKEVQAAQLTELLVATRNRFKELLDEIESLREENWSDAEFRKELVKALQVVDSGRIEYNKGLGRINALEQETEPILERGSQAKPDFSRHAADRSFGQWVKIGFAVSVPFWLLAIVVTLVYLAARSGFRW